MLYQLSYASPPDCGNGERTLERETGLEPATNSLEGCDSTIELLPPGLATASLYGTGFRRVNRRGRHERGQRAPRESNITLKVWKRM